MTFAIVFKNPGAASHRVDQQVQVSVAVDVGENGACRILVSATDTGGVRDILKPPVAEIAKERVVPAIEATKINITETVAIHVPQSDARTIQQVLIGDRSFVGNEVGKGNPGGFRRQQRETDLAEFGHRQFAPTIARPGLPVQLAALSQGATRQEQGPQGKLKQCACGGVWPVQKTFHGRSTLIFPSISTSISRAPAGTGFVVVLPPGHLTQICVGTWGAPSTCTAPSCDQ